MNFKETLNQLLNENAPPMMRGRSMPSRPRQMPGSGYGRPPMQPGIRPGTFAGAPEGMFRRPTPESMPQRQGTAMQPKPYADPSVQAAPSMGMPPAQQQGMGMQQPMGQGMGMSQSQVPFSRVGMMTQPSAVPTAPQMPFDMPQEQPLEFGGQPSLPDVPMTPEVQMQPPQAERMSAPRMPTSTQMMGGPSSQPVSTPDILKAMEPSMFANFMTNKAKSPAPTQSPQPQPQPQPQGQGMGMGIGGMRMGGMRMRANPMQSPNAPVSDVSQGQVMQPEYVPSELRMGDSGEFDYNAPSQYAMSQNRFMSPEEHMRRRKAYFRESLESSLKKKISEQVATPTIDDVMREIEKRERAKLPDYAKSPELLLRKEQDFKIDDPSKYSKTSFKSSHEYGEKMREVGRKFRANQFFLIPPEIATDFPNVTKGRFPYRSER